MRALRALRSVPVPETLVSPSVDLSPECVQPRLEAFLRTHWGRAVEVASLRRFPVGMSWITMGFEAHSTDDDGHAVRHDLILRVGAPSGLLAPYHAEPEYHVLTALAGMPHLPVPRAHAYSDDHEVLGAPFLITARVPGDTPMPWKGASEAREEAHNRSLGHDFADALGALHAFDWRATPLARLWGEVDGRRVALEQTRLWARHAGMDTYAQPQMQYALRWLEANAPAAERVSIVHGDYRVGNFLQQDGRITAILDWELMHAGDPHEDLAWAGLRTFAAGTDRIGGLISRDEFYARPTALSGFTIHPEVVRYYEVLVQFKMAAMLIGAVRRIESGRAHDIRMASMGFQLAPTLLELNRLIGAAA